MKRIDLVKYGFVRCPEEDFAVNDGSRFTCYKVGRVVISKLVSDGQLYLAGNIDGSKLSYEEYSKLSHYRSMNHLNGVSAAGITEEDIKKFYEDCKTYDAEYAKAEAETVMPTYEEILEVYRKIRDARIKEYNKILSLANVPLVCSLKDYTLKNFIDYFNTLKYAAKLNIEEAARRNTGTAYSKSIVNPIYVDAECLPGFYYKQLLDLIEKAKTN